MLKRVITMNLMETFIHSLPILSIGAYPILAMAVVNKSDNGIIEEGKYAIPNSWEEGRQRLTCLQKLQDNESQARVKPLLQPGGTFLEVGPGLGSMTHFLAEHAKKVTALDIDDTFLSDVAATSPKVTVVQGDIATYDPGVETFNFIFMRLVLMHLTRNDNQALINRLARSLKPGGYLYIEDLVDGAFKYRFCELGKLDSRLMDYMSAVYERMSGYMSFEQGYYVAEMMAAAGLTNISADLTCQRVQGGENNYGHLMQLTSRQLEPYLRDIPNHDTLFPKLLQAWVNPQIHWFENSRCFNVGQKP